MIGPFDYWNEHGQIIYKDGDVVIYKMDGEEYLFVGQILYASSAERNWYLNNLNFPGRRRVLELGLGLGVASRMFLANGAKHLTTIELEEGVIKAFGVPKLNHTIVHMNADDYVERALLFPPQFDLIFVDHYARIDEEMFDYLKGLAEKLKRLLLPGGNLIFWIDEFLPDAEIARLRSLWI